jgi:MarR family transcriptional regulator, lower aerobic nicotinate degradation pathway regulator
MGGSIVCQVRDPIEQSAESAMSELSQRGQLPPFPYRWLGLLLQRTAQRAYSTMSHALAPVGLRPPHNSILSALESGNYSQAKLADQMGIDRTTMVSLLDDLERQELVTRQKNPRDRRAHVVSLTEAGRKTLNYANTMVEQADHEFFSVLSSEERTVLEDILTRLLKSQRATH